MPSVSVNIFFCEDLRMENNGKPMFIGVLSPVIDLFEDEEFAPALNLVTMFYCSNDLSSIDVQLDVIATNMHHNDVEQFPKSFSKTFTKPDQFSERDPWNAISYLDISGITFVPDLEIMATVNAGGYISKIPLCVRRHKDETQAHRIETAD